MIEVLAPTILFASAVAVFAIAAVAVRYWSPWACPECGRRAVSTVDNGVLYDPAPERSLCRCEKCGAEMVRTAGRWVRRADWTDAEDQRIWDELNADRRVSATAEVSRPAECDLEYEAGRKYEFVRMVDGQIELATFMRFDDGSAYVSFPDGGSRIYENNDDVWRKAVADLVTAGFRFDSGKVL